MANVHLILMVKCHINRGTPLLNTIVLVMISERYDKAFNLAIEVLAIISQTIVWLEALRGDIFLVLVVVVEGQGGILP